MKTYNAKMAIFAFMAIVAFDVAWFFLWHGISSSWLGYPVGIMSFVVNLPGLPLFHYLPDYVPAGYLSDGSLIVGCALLSAFMWSLISGFVFRHKCNA